MNSKISIAIHGYGTYAALYRNLIEHAKIAAPDVDWAMILPTSHHLDAVREVLPPDRLLCLEYMQSRTLPEDTHPSEFTEYAGNVYADIETEKKVYKHRPASEQVARAAEAYKIYRAFLKRIKPTHLLFAHVETFEGKMLFSIAKELNISAILPVDLRSFGGTAFCSGPDETLPSYRTANKAFVSQSARFLDDFRKNPKPSWNPGMFALPVGDEPLPLYEKPFLQRALSFAKRTLKNPDLFEPVLLATSVKYAFPKAVEAFRSIRASRNRRQFDLETLEELPAKFVYYPLQTTPESSINTPAPYFIDQMRAIDAIRFAMPSDCTLIVKEHWASLNIRPGSFYKALRRKAGVKVVHSNLSSVELIKRAQLTISVTGSATLEAYLLGRPSLVLGGCFIASYLGGVCSIDSLASRVQHAIENPPRDEDVLKALTEIYDARYECLIRPADEPGYYSNRPENIRRMLNSILDHIERSRRFSETRQGLTGGGVEAAESGSFALGRH
ncbi:hypothetical protein [Afipia broomeae]|uniref:Capsule polysaccharide biosynthesis protein n=1 Tax=Afipia broomeae ATCC 49717 TaxID=883078 RepID=K8P1B1_9BRAD|nr:hypothetical protein [Afipia broomeae]EKS36377.1 hypothetical protein HMPREF9695_02795 [Afipia broomeae ATCC 49717]